MGLYDNRCMISGLSLKSSKTILVLLEKNEDRYLPITLPITGQYNRLGSIDMITENKNTETVLRFFILVKNTKELIVDWNETGLKNFETTEQFLQAVERGVTMEYDCVTLNKKRLEFALIDKTIWDGITKNILLNETGEPMNRSDYFWEIYTSDFTEPEGLLPEIEKVDQFLKLNGIKWQPPQDASQHYEEEITEYLEEAKERFKENAFMLKSILEYEQNPED